MALVRIRLSPTWTFLIFAVLLILLLGLRAWQPAAMGPPLENKLAETQKTAIEIALEMNKLVISLATLVFGAVGIFATMNDDASRSAVQMVLIGTVLFCAALALYFSYALYDALVEMLSNDVLDLQGPAFKRPRMAQVYSLLTAVIALGLLVMRTFAAERRSDEEDDLT